MAFSRNQVGKKAFSEISNDEEVYQTILIISGLILSIDYNFIPFDHL
jgi:hypothetical protein